MPIKDKWEIIGETVEKGHGIDEHSTYSTEGPSNYSFRTENEKKNYFKKEKQ